MRRSILTRLLVGVLAALVVMIGVEVGVAQEAQETSTASPTPSPADLELARELADHGDVAAAIAAYRSYVEDGNVPERPAALLELSKLLLSEDEGASAARYLDTHLFEASPGADVRAAQFLLAEALAQRGDWSGALALYDAYLEAGGLAAPYAQMGRTQALVRLGRAGEAEAQAQTLLDEDLPMAARTALVRSLAQAYEAANDLEGALTWYATLAEIGSPSEQADALWQSVVLRLRASAGDWLPDLITLVQRYPSSSAALDAVNAFPELADSIDEFYLGLVLYQHGQDAEARPILERVREGPQSPNAARAAYYVAAMDEREGAVDKAIHGYARVLEIDPNIELADDALWWRGKLLELEGNVERATGDYERLASEFPGSERGREARFRLALLDYDAGRYEDAAGAYAALASDVTGEERDRATLWRGKALAADGHADAAASVWQTLAQQRDGYFALRAGALLGTESISLDDASFGEETPDWPSIAAWLRGEDGDATPTTTASSSEGHLRLGNELSSLGLQARAEAEFELALDDADDAPGELLDVASQLDALQLHHLSARAAARLLLTIDEGAAAAPEDLWRAAYPTPFSEELSAAAESSDVPPLLLYSMVRQESFFNPRAGSPAGALGLTQVIGPTGDAIAQDLGIEDFEIDDLYQPDTSLRFGAHYLAQQLDAFDGNLYHALAAYNGGPGNALRWADASEEDVDRFYEEIDFAETRLYIELVSGNLAHYLDLYGEVDGPALPGDPD